MKSRVFGVFGLSLLLLVPSAALAQDSGIAGGVNDSTGGALPGVTVEVASPVMIEGSRAAVTDGQGRYAVTLLRPGTYTVTFTLPGFSTVIREGIELQAAFTANVDVQLSVGAVEETVTVSGASPTIDIQRVQQRQVVTNEVIDALPMNKDWAQIGALTVGITPTTQDVGGARQGNHSYLSAHGSDARDGMRRMDGMAMGMLSCGYSCTVLLANDSNTEELSYEVGAISAEVSIGGVTVNIIPKEGGNVFSGDAFGNFSNSSMQGNNLSEELLASGLRKPDGIEDIWDTHLTLGGPILQDKLWFHGSYRYWGISLSPADTFHDVDPLDYVYEPDLTRPGFGELKIHSASLRLTYQANQRNKFSAYYNTQPKRSPMGNPTALRTPESQHDQRNPVNYHATTTWTNTLSSRILIEAGASVQTTTATTDPQVGAPPIHAARELTTGVRFRARGVHNRWNEVHRSYKGAVSYVTGSHSLKAGFTLDEGRWARGSQTFAPTDSELLLFNGSPVAIIAHATPYTVNVDLKADLGFYVQDTWTIDRMTLNLGVRWDYLRQDVPEQDTSAFANQPFGSNPPGTWAPSRHYDAIPKAANWTDLGPRLGVAYDVFGDGRTAIKGSVSRYLRVDTIGLSANLNPVNSSVNATTRSWRDTNGDFFPDENELGPFDNASFGQTIIRTTFDDDVRSGFGNRRNNWEYSIGIEQEILPRTSAEVSFWRRVQGNFSVVDNILVDPGDFDEYCVTAPVDPRLPDGGGNEICGLYDVSPDKFGQVQNEVILADQLGASMDQVFDGIDFSINSRVSGDLFFYGGVSVGRSRFNDCNARVDSPSVVPVAVQSGGAGSGGGWDVRDRDNPDLRLPVGHHCDVNPPFFQPTWKLSGAYTLPYDIQVAAFFQNLPGVPILGTWNVPNALIEPSLGRPLAGGARTATVELVEPGTLYADRITQMDLRVAKIIRLGGAGQLKVMLDAYNLFNGTGTTGINNRYGSRWQSPTQVLLARFVKLGAQFNF